MMINIRVIHLLNVLLKSHDKDIKDLLDELNDNFVSELIKDRICMIKKISDKYNLSYNELYTQYITNDPFVKNSIYDPIIEENIKNKEKNTIVKLELQVVNNNEYYVDKDGGGVYDINGNKKGTYVENTIILF